VTISQQAFSSSRRRSRIYWAGGDEIHYACPRLLLLQTAVTTYFPQAASKGSADGEYPLGPLAWWVWARSLLMTTTTRSCIIKSYCRVRQHLCIQGQQHHSPVICLLSVTPLYRAIYGPLSSYCCHKTTHSPPFA